MKFNLLHNPTIMTFNLTIGDWTAVEGVQKIGGFSRGWHQWNSIRLGYNRSENDRVRLQLYAYIKGRQQSKVIGYFNPGDKVDIQLIWGATWIEAVANNNMATLYNGNNACKLGYQLYPYAEIDGDDNKRVPFDVEVRDLKVG
jgi:hypothetical protein